MSTIADRYLKTTKNPHAYSLKEDKYPITDWISTGNLALNTLISADPNKGIPTGRIIQFAGPASVGKSYVSAQVVIEAQKKGYTCFIFDTEGAGNREQWIQRGLDEELTVHIPIVGINSTRIEILTILEEIKKTDKALIVVDSLGNLLSDKEMKDQFKDDAPVDMTKAKDLKKFFRQIAIELMVKNVPCIVVNHEYSCISGETLIKTPKGDIEIKDLNIGDEVLTMFGYKKISDKFEYDDIPQLFEMELENGNKVQCTSFHKFLTRNKDNLEWKELQDLTPGDSIIQS